MPSYNTKENISEVHIPEWSVYTPGQDGCGTHWNYTEGRNSYAPSGAVFSYENPPPERFKQRRVSGRWTGPVPFMMTPYYVSERRVQNFLLRRHNGSNACIQYRRVAHRHLVGGYCNAHTDHYEDAVGPLAVTWDDVTHVGTGNTYTVTSISDEEVASALAGAKDNAAVQALSSYDLLTEVAEAREIPGLVRSISQDIFSILRALHGRFSMSDLRRAATMSPRKLLGHYSRALRKLGNEWMQYRYAIMPLVYSYRDIQKTVDRGIDNTTRGTRYINAEQTNVTLPASTEFYLRKETTGNIICRATVFQHFDWEVVAQLAGVSTNLLVTAWELVPYSFVVDWFVNVGDYITRTTSANLANVTFACFSRRDNYVTRTFQHFPNQTISLTPQRLWGFWDAGEIPASDPPVVIQRPEELQLLQEVKVNSYYRDLFNVGDAPLRVSPSLNWKRLLDSAVMANNQLRAFGKLFK